MFKNHAKREIFPLFQRVLALIRFRPKTSLSPCRALFIDIPLLFDIPPTSKGIMQRGGAQEKCRENAIVEKCAPFISVKASFIFLLGLEEK